MGVYPHPQEPSSSFCLRKACLAWPAFPYLSDESPSCLLCPHLLPHLPCDPAALSQMSPRQSPTCSLGVHAPKSAHTLVWRLLAKEEQTSAPEEAGRNAESWGRSREKTASSLQSEAGLTVTARGCLYLYVVPHCLATRSPPAGLRGPPGKESPFWSGLAAHASP